jgi:transcriptional regulator with XRE-family HTH domain
VVHPVKEEQLLKEFGHWISLLRKDARMTQQQLAEATDMSVVAIAYIENGKRWPRLATIQKIAKALNCTLSEVFHAFHKR